MASTDEERAAASLGECDVALVARHDLVMLDLDGVVYVGPHAVPHAAQVVGDLGRHGARHAYVTNNASRPPAAVAAHLRELGLPAADDDVVTSSQAAARLLVDLVGEAGRVFVVGGEGLDHALAERGLVATREVGDGVGAVVSGYHPDVRWGTVMTGAVLVADGVPWVATNRDLTVPTPHGPGPGHGVLVGAIAAFAEVEPVVAGKPEPPLLEETIARRGGRRPLMVGDRLDTDIEGARRVGCDSLLVMTGVTDLAALVAARPAERPTYVGADLRALLTPQPAPSVTTDATSVTSRLGGWTARSDAGRLQVEGDGSASDWWRVVAVAAWTHLDGTGEPLDVTAARPPDE